MRRLAAWLLDSGPVLLLALIAGAGSFTHIRDTAIEHGQTGWMSWAIAVCVDLTCVMAARERQRDKKTGRERTGPTSWPTLVLIAGITLSLAANLHQAEPTTWGWITAAIPAAAFLIAVSMLERRGADPRPQPAPEASSAAITPSPASALVQAPTETAPHGHTSGRGDAPGPSPALLDYARRVIDEHRAKHGKPITSDLLRTRLGISHQLASGLLRHLQLTPDAL
ncbi:DUF2637 domain-containing protein [Microtetraspora sp. NBRC 13810]|uniref:DUF2637 domain-containing protein n=1 Tax=Microtetraspora sp. NBRC 13810 TaxID=3030990 RepID=UPI002553439F|nr:DUF2637 domain-containing protein [Microtetraspora sp. NBRC 13810]